jgi:DeoR/GlpR family transcriptional regulator of sugar metabolism
MVERAETFIVLADSNKFSTVWLISFAQLGQVDRATTNVRLVKRPVT